LTFSKPVDAGHRSCDLLPETCALRLTVRVARRQAAGRDAIDDVVRPPPSSSGRRRDPHFMFDPSASRTSSTTSPFQDGIRAAADDRPVSTCRGMPRRERIGGRQLI
jgi:hypothetical protein